LKKTTSACEHEQVSDGPTRAYESVDYLPNKIYKHHKSKLINYTSILHT